ncbi:SseB family protein [Streptomyces silvisoli]|uniref:SseB family protein n=1 Tax=Streptomyces silvisoli TaxID=3034235 RepID=A0ABT5ZQD2_9ACTN|nr:SseB family protein [Streptomyces silvisoli]MDF3292035.1 SseB family protein [Streptomyces silvisoli]
MRSSNANWDRRLNLYGFNAEGEPTAATRRNNALGPVAYAPPDARCELADEITAMHQGNGEPKRLLDGFRDSVVLLPLIEGHAWSAEWGGVRWLYAFSGELELTAFLRSRGGATGEEGQEYVRAAGAQLLDVVIPEVGEPAGVALDVGSRRPMLFPPVAGIVPNAVAVDVRGMA